VEYGNTEGKITIKEAEYEHIALEIKEGRKENIIAIESDGSVFVNGEEAQFYPEEDNEILLDKAMYNTTKCPYGSASAYTKKTIDGKKVGYVNLTSGAVTLGAIAVGVVLAAFNPTLFATIAATVITGVISYWATEKLNPKYISVKRYEYVHKSKGWQVKSNMATEKRIFKLYPSKNYMGKSKNTKASWRVYAW